MPGPRRGRRSTRSRRASRRRSRRGQRGGGPTLLSASNAPPPSSAKTLLSVVFTEKVIADEDGPLVKREDVQHEPSVSWKETGAGPLTFVCWDPDAVAKSWLHWLVVNATGSDPSSGEEILPWTPPAPPPGPEPHRYIFAVLQQSGKIPVSAPAGRGNFNPAIFAEKHGLRALAFQGIRVAPAPA